MFDDLIPQAPQTASISPTQRAFLNAMRGGESGGRYNVMYGGKTFDSYADHPRQPQPIRSGPNAGKVSTAAGADQFLAGTWDEAKNALGLPDFSPGSQDAASVWLAGRDYKKRTGRDLWKDIEEAQGDPKRLSVIGGALSKTWTSLPGGIEPNRATGGFAQRLAQEFSAQSRQPSLSFDDLIPQQSPAQLVDARSGQFQTPQNASVLQEGLARQATQMQNATRGPAADPLVRQSVEFQNQQIAGGQGTTPNMDLQMQNLITDQVFENDAGMAVFRDPATGQLVEADKNRHVVMRDPQDNRLKVFARSEATAENPAVSGARVLAQGLAAGAPTARAAIPGTIAVTRNEPVITGVTKGPGGTIIDQKMKPVTLMERDPSYVPSRTPTPAPTREQLFDAADEGYTAARELGVLYNPAAVADMAFDIQGALVRGGHNEITAPNTYKILGKFGNKVDDAKPGVAVDFNDLESVRRALGKIAQGHSSPDAIVRSDAGAAVEAIKKLDDFFANPAGAVRGNAEELARIAKDARGNTAAAKRSERVAGVADTAELNAATAGSGANVDNTLRQAAKSALRDKKFTASLTPQELAELRKVSVGTPVRNIMRWVGKLAPTGVVSSALSGGGGFALGGGVGAIALPLTGFAAKKIADVMTANQLAKLDELLRSRSPLAKQMQSAIDDWGQKANKLADVPNAPKVAQFALASRNLVSNLKDAGITISPSEFMKVLQGPKGAPAEDEKQ